MLDVSFLLVRWLHSLCSHQAAEHNVVQSLEDSKGMKYEVSLAKRLKRLSYIIGYYSQTYCYASGIAPM